MSTDNLLFPKFNYYLDECVPDIMILRCQDGSFVAAFNPDGVTKEGMIEAAKEDYWERIKDHWAGEAGVPLRNTAALNSSTEAYSPNDLEGFFSEVHRSRSLDVPVRSRCCPRG